MRSKANRLTRPNQRQLEDLIIKHKKEIVEGAWNKEKFAVHASDVMKMPITEANVYAAAKAINVNFPYGTQGRGAKNVKEVRAAIKVIAAELVRLGGELGHVVTPEVVALSEIGE